MLSQARFGIQIIKKCPVISDLIWNPGINKELNILKGATYDIC